MELDRTEPARVADDASVRAAAERLGDIEPSDDSPPADLAGDLVALASAVAAVGGTEAVVVARPDAPTVEAAAARAGFSPCRGLVQLRRPLPLEEAHRRAAADHPATPRLRSFRPGEDDEAWLAVNHRAFAWHPDQGDLGPAELAERLDEPWFDAEGFLVLDGEAGAIDGFCWTKVHPATDVDPALGEIYVIGVDPDAHGRGLGRALVVAGLEHLHRAGLRTAMLYTEDDNRAARGLYDSLGFELHHRDRWYRWDATAS